MKKLFLFLLINVVSLALVSCPVDNNTEQQIVFAGYVISISEIDGSVTFYGLNQVWTENNGDFYVPEQLLGRPVKKIGEQLFSARIYQTLSGVKNLYLPHTVDSIDVKAFKNPPSTLECVYWDKKISCMSQEISDRIKFYAKDANNEYKCINEGEN